MCRLLVVFSALLDLWAQKSRDRRHVKLPRCGEASRKPRALNWDRSQAIGSLCKWNWMVEKASKFFSKNLQEKILETNCAATSPTRSLVRWIAALYMTQTYVAWRRRKKSTHSMTSSLVSLRSTFCFCGSLDIVPFCNCGLANWEKFYHFRILKKPYDIHKRRQRVIKLGMASTFSRWYTVVQCRISFIFASALARRAKSIAVWSYMRYPLPKKLCLESISKSQPQSKLDVATQIISRASWAHLVEKYSRICHQQKKWIFMNIS